MKALGVVLQPGERLLYFHEVDMQRRRLIGGLFSGFMLVVGLLSMWFTCITAILALFGGWGLFKALNPSKDAVVGMLLTNQRLVAVPFDGHARPPEVALSELADVDCTRKTKRYLRARGLASVALDAAANVARELHQNAQGKTQSKYWSNAVCLHVVLHGGRKLKWQMDPDQGPILGPLLATGLSQGWASLSAAHGAPEERSKSRL